MNEEIQHAQTVLKLSDIKKLKTKSGHESTKDALGTAVEHYLNCKNTKEQKETKDEVKL